MVSLLTALTLLVVLDCTAASQYIHYPARQLRLTKHNSASLPGDLISGHNITACMDKCDEMAECKMFNYNQVKDKCWFKSATKEDLPNRVRDKNEVVDIYEKVAPGSECIQGTKFRPFGDCSSTYCECNHAEWIPRMCAPNTVFNNDILTCDFPNNACHECPTSDGFAMVQGRCVRLFNDSHLPAIARETCSNFGAILYPFRSLVQDQGLLQALMQAAGKTSVMVGVSDAADDDVFVADDGTPVEDEVWAVGQPNHAPGEDCAYVKENLGFKLADTSCTNGFPYVCEVPV